MAAPLAAFAAPAELLVNGSFEDDSMSAGNWAILSGLTGWSAAAHGVALRNAVAGTALAGVNYVELDTSANSNISQTVSTVDGQWYSLSFNDSNRIDTAVSSHGLSWRFGSSSDGLGTSLDKVSLTTAVPEPQTYALTLAGLIAVGFIARRRAKL